VCRNANGQTKLELVHETKGRTHLENLRFASEALKIRCAQELFVKLGIDYRAFDDKEVHWWKPDGFTPQDALRLTES
jgi:restriction endonuclease